MTFTPKFTPTRVRLLPVTLTVIGAVVAGFLVVWARAATPASFEAEVGTVAAPATKVANAAASGGQAVKFGPATPTPTPTPSGNPSGQAMPVGDLPGWHQIFTDDFTTNVALGSFPGTVYGPKWQGYNGCCDSAKIGTYSPAKVLSVNGGALDMYLHTEGTTPYGAAPIPKIASYGQTYGRYTVRWRADSLPGFAVAWLLWPDSEIWAEGELDFPEGTLDGNIGGFAHETTGTPRNNAWSVQTGTPMNAGWHTTTIEWTPTSLTYRLDDRSWTTTNSVAIPTHSMHWVLQTETAYGARPDPATAGHIQIDWVSIYSYTP